MKKVSNKFYRLNNLYKLGPRLVLLGSISQKAGQGDKKKGTTDSKLGHKIQ